MYTLDETRNRVYGITIAIVIITFGLGVIFGADPLRYGLGLLLGSLFSMAKLKFLQNSIDKAADMPSANAINYMKFNYMLRYISTGLIMASPFILDRAFGIDIIDFLGTVLGVTSLQAALYIFGFIVKKNQKKNTSEKEKISRNSP